jgi:cyanoexosortase B-associated protein
MNSLKSKLNLSAMMPQTKGGRSIAYFTLILLLMFVLAFGAIPDYLKGNWSGTIIPEPSQINRVKALKKTSLNIPDWQTLDHAEPFLGGNKWSAQRLEKKGHPPVDLLLLPQNSYGHQPEVEWTDVKGNQKWKTDPETILKFPAQPGGKEQVEARFFRAWNTQTFAVVQWYAWPGGGSFSTSQWFWADQWLQLRGRRLTWIAVSIIIPIEPFSDLKATENLAKSLAQSVQFTLEKDIFQSAKLN